MKTKINLILSLFTLVIITIQAQNKLASISYFEQLRTLRVESNPNIVWKSIAPGTSGYCEEFWCHPTDANVMFSGPDMHATFGTWDNGTSWQTIKDYDGNGMDMRRVIDIQFSLQNPDFGIAFSNKQNGSTTSGEIYKTTDRGRTWSVAANMGKCHSKLAIHPTDDNIWFLGAGDFWNVKENHRNLANPNGLLISRASYGYVWKTTDKGATWKKVASDISSNLDVGRILFNPSSPNIMIMATGQGMYRSTDTGETWTASSTGLPNNLPRDLTSYYNASTNEFVLYAVEQTKYVPNGTSITSVGGIYKSTDAGLSWQSITGNLGLNMQSITDAATQDDYHRSVAYWLGITTTLSKSTYSTYPANALQVFNRIVVNPTNKDEIYLLHNKRHDYSFGPGDVWKTTNGGQTWFTVSRFGTYWSAQADKAYWDSKGNSTTPNVDFAHLQNQLDSERENTSGARMLAINSLGNVFVGLNQQLLRSNDAGSTWTQIDDVETEVGSNKWIGRGNTNLPGRFLLLETGVPGRKLMCSGEHGLWQTTDLGSYPDKEAVAVEQIEGQNNAGGATTISTVAVHPTDPNIIYFLSSRQDHRGKLRRSTDGGKTWTNISTIFTASNNSWEDVAPQYSLMIDPVNPNNMYFCSIRKAVQEVGSSIDESILTLGGYGVYRSTDAGYNWTLSNSGLPATGSVRRLTMDPKNPSIIYASINQFSNTDPGGLYKSIDGALNWSEVSIPSEIKSVNNLFIDRNTGYMFISAGARSGALAAGGVWRSTNNGATWERIFEAPYIWQTEVSPVNSNIITISAATQVGTSLDNFKNPGVYLSINGGTSWIKINNGLAHSDRTVDIKPDPVDPTILWCAGWGSGWYRAKFDMTVLGTKKISTFLPNIDLYPNPIVNGKLNVTNITDNTKYSINNIQGKMIKTGLISGNNPIDVSNLNAGIYIIKLVTSQINVAKKFVVK